MVGNLGELARSTDETWSVEHRLAVVYDKGAATPADIGIGVGGLSDRLVVLGDSVEAERARPLFEEFGDVVSLSTGESSVIAALRSAGVTGIVTFSDRMVRTTSALADALGLAYHSPATADALTDKLRQREILRQQGIDRTRSAQLADRRDWAAVAGRIGLPVVIKPVNGEGSRNTFKVDDLDEGASLLDRLAGAERFVVEECLAGRDEGLFGDYVSVECVAAQGDVVALAVTGKLPLLPPFRETGQFWPARLTAEDDAAVRDLAVRAVRALGVTTGLTHTEIKLTPEGPRIIEVNGRLGGNLPDLARRATGLDLVALAGRIALGHPVEIEPVRPDQVYFQYTNPAPALTSRLVKIAGAGEVRRLPGVSSYQPVFRAGEQIAAGVGTTTLDVLGGHAADHDAMLAVIGSALERLSYVFSIDGETVEISAPELARSGQYASW